MKIVITNAFGPQNRGDHELLQSLISLLSINLKNAKIHVYTTYPEESRKCFPSNILFDKSPFGRPINLIEFLYLLWDLFFWISACYWRPMMHMLTKKRHSAYKNIIGADMVIMCPGGYLYSNGKSLYVNILNAMPSKVAKGITLAAPMSIGPFTNRYDVALTSYLLSGIDYIHTRESYSTALVKSLGLKPVQTPDLAWNYSTENEQIEDDITWKGHFACTVIDWNYPDSNSPSMEKLRYESMILIACKRLSDISHGKPVILYNQVGSGFGDSPDEKLISRLIIKSNGCIIFDNTAVTPSILRSRLKHCEGLLASRFHSALFAIQVRIPFIAIAYQPKARFILRDLGLEDLCRSIDKIDGEKIADDLAKICIKKIEFEKRLIYAQRANIFLIEHNFIDLLKKLNSRKFY